MPKKSLKRKIDAHQQQLCITSASLRSRTKTAERDKSQESLVKPKITLTESYHNNDNIDKNDKNEKNDNNHNNEKNDNNETNDKNDKNDKKDKNENNEWNDASDGSDDCDDHNYNNDGVQESNEQNARKDSFSVHFDTELDALDVDCLKKSNEKSYEEMHWHSIGNIVCVNNKLNKIIDNKLVCLENINEFNINKIIVENLEKTVKDFSGEMSDLNYQLLSIITSYKDFLYTERTFKNGEQMRVMYSLHALNHVLKSRLKILRHNSKLRLHMTTKEFRDQGLTRPKVLILVPFRESVLRIIKIMISFMFGNCNDETDTKFNVMNLKRFIEEFSGEEESPKMHKKPEDYENTFTGNVDDSFRIGISITKKSLKLFADFYSSDILIASPLGLRTIIGAEGETERDFDFLSSIEIFILDQTDIFMMQNWEHVLHIAKHLNLQPNDSHGVDFSRVRMSILEGWAKYYRQLLVFSSVNVSTITSFFNRFSLNFSGQVVTKNIVNSEMAAVNRVYIQCPQIFHRYSCSSITESADQRFQFFVSTILPKFKEPLMVRTMIYIPSYFDFVRLRNYFRREELSFTQICEYTKDGKVAKARSMFFNSGRHFMLYTERFHYYHRYRIKGIRHLIFYALPTYPHLYYEMCNFMHHSMQGKKFASDYSSMSSTVVYNKYDALQLTSTVGHDKAVIMLKSPKDVHMFVTENDSNH